MAVGHAVALKCCVDACLALTPTQPASKQHGHDYSLRGMNNQHNYYIAAAWPLLGQALDCFGCGACAHPRLLGGLSKGLILLTLSRMTA